MTITNTLETARRLEKLGFDHEQAQGLADIFEDTAHATRPDLSALVTKDYLHNEMQALELRMAEHLRSQMLWFFGMFVGLLGLTIAILKLLP